MKGFFAAVCVFAASVSVVRGDCEELKAISLPLSGDTTVTLSSAEALCDNVGIAELEEFVIEGGTLTLTGPSEARFANLRFIVADGAGLIFDFEETQFGPNFDYETEDYYGYFMLEVMEGGYGEFSGTMYATEVENYYSVFYNEGTLEFKSDAHFYDCGTNVFRENRGKLRFRGDATFENNVYLGIDNIGGTVRIAGESLFNDTGRWYDGANGAAFANSNDGIAIFDGMAVFVDTRSDQSGGAVYNSGKMKFYGKAQFYDNWSGEDGGALFNSGDLRFFGAVQMIGNRAFEKGGGLAVASGGSATFRRRVTIQYNNATETGGAMSIMDGDTSGSTVELGKPDKVRITNNRKTGSELGCNSIYLEPNSELIGYDVEDLCDES